MAEVLGRNLGEIFKKTKTVLLWNDSSKTTFVCTSIKQKVSEKKEIANEVHLHLTFRIVT